MIPDLPSCDVAIDDQNWISFYRTSRVCAFFNTHSIHFDGAILQPNPDACVYVSKEGPIEEYTFFSGDFARPMGAFSYSHSPAKTLGVSTGRYCSIGNSLRVMGERHPLEWVTTSNITYCFRPDWNKPNFIRAHQDLMHGRWKPSPPPNLLRANPVLGHDVWIADNVTLATGITIGTGAIAGSGAVVTKDVAPYSIVAGNPARIVRRRFDDALCDRLLASGWWRYHPDALFMFDRENPGRFLDELAEAKTTGKIGLSPVLSFSWRDMVNEISKL